MHRIRPLDQVEKLHARSRIVLEDSEHRTRDRDGVLLLHAPHRHAEVRRFDHDADAQRPDLLPQRFGNRRA